mmetsp:Transcript_2925/g.10576  ORF Transcript_2925/g.10576 Transcript_2925/m.10576 type:complete len:266 (+) Transcript_2925:260-1057(+)
MFDVSFVQLGLVLGAGVLVLGPKELPVVSRLAGRAVGRAMRLLLDARAQWEAIARETGEINELQSSLRSGLSEYHQFRSELRQGFNTLRSSARVSPVARAEVSHVQATNDKADPASRPHRSTSSNSSFAAQPLTDQHRTGSLSEYHLHEMISLAAELREMRRQEDDAHHVGATSATDFLVAEKETQDHSPQHRRELARLRMQRSSGADILLEAEEERELASIIATQLAAIDGDIYTQPAASATVTSQAEEEFQRPHSNPSGKEDH